MQIDPHFGNHNGDNLTEAPEDEFDATAHHHWNNPPVKKAFAVPRNVIRRSDAEEWPVPDLDEDWTESVKTSNTGS